MNSIVISINVDINEKRKEIFFEKSSFTKLKNLLINQLFFKFSVTISAEILSTCDSLTVRIVLLTAESALMILCFFSHRAVRAALKNIDSSTLTILHSDLQAVRVALLTHRLHSWSQKDEVASVVQQVQKLTWMKLILAYLKNFYRQSIKLTWILLAKQNVILFEDFDIYF